jgi:cysteine synthase A
MQRLSNLTSTNKHTPSCMPDDQAKEKSDLLLKLGAEVERVRPAPIVDQNQFVNMARRRAQEHTSSTTKPGRGIFADQFENTANWQAHFSGTGPEIYAQCNGHLDAFVSGAGTGGTISGVALFLKPKLPDLKVVLADPEGSGLFNRVKYGVMFDAKEKEGTKRRSQVDTVVEGIGINRVTANFEAGRELVDDAYRVNDEQALAMARWLVEKDGVFVGSSSAVNCKILLSLSEALWLIREQVWQRQCWLRSWVLGIGLLPYYAILVGSSTRKSSCTSHSFVGSRHLSKFWAQAGEIGGEVNMTLDNVLKVGIKPSQ